MNCRHLFFGGSVLLNIVLVWNLVWGTQGLVSYRALQQEFMVMNERIESLNHKNVALSREIKLLQSDDKYIEQMIRKRLNYIKDNEIWYVFPDERNIGEGEGLNEAEN